MLAMSQCTLSYVCVHVAFSFSEVVVDSFGKKEVYAIRSIEPVLR